MPGPPEEAWIDAPAVIPQADEAVKIGADIGIRSQPALPVCLSSRLRHPEMGRTHDLLVYDLPETPSLLRASSCQISNPILALSLIDLSCLEEKVVDQCIDHSPMARLTSQA